LSPEEFGQRYAELLSGTDSDLVQDDDDDD
jgi:hypothetical protein